MEFAYAGANIISLAVWTALFLRRKDLRAMMVLMSVCAMPLAFFDLLFVPSYWVPVTLFNIPIGVEGFIYAFSIGGIASVLYAELTKTRPQRIAKRAKSMHKAIWIPAITFVAFVATYWLGLPNPMLCGYVAVTAGVIATLVVRKDLARSALLGAVAFGFVYFFALKVWTIFFPEVHAWFTFTNLPQAFLWDVPLWELLFGVSFGAYWTNLYELLFGYKLVPLKSTSLRPKPTRTVL